MSQSTGITLDYEMVMITLCLKQRYCVIWFKIAVAQKCSNRSAVLNGGGILSMEEETEPP